MSDEPNIRLTGEQFRVSASETVSTGDYENYEPFVAIEGSISTDSSPEESASDLLGQSIDPAADVTANIELDFAGQDGAELTQAQRQELKQRLLSLHGDLQEVLERATANRVAIKDHEDWELTPDSPGND